MIINDKTNIVREIVLVKRKRNTMAKGRSSSSNHKKDGKGNGNHKTRNPNNGSNSGNNNNNNNNSNSKQKTLFSFWGKQSTDNHKFKSQLLPQEAEAAGPSPPPPPPKRSEQAGDTPPLRHSKKRSIVKVDKTTATAKPTPLKVVRATSRHNNDDSPPESSPSPSPAPVGEDESTTVLSRSDGRKAGAKFDKDNESGKGAEQEIDNEAQISKRAKMASSLRHDRQNIDACTLPFPKLKVAATAAPENSNQFFLSSVGKAPNPSLTSSSTPNLIPTDHATTPMTERKKTEPADASFGANDTYDDDQDDESDDSGNGSDGTGGTDDEDTSNADTKQGGLSDYERLRLRNIARNQARLQELGLLSANSNCHQGTPQPRRRQQRRKLTARKMAVSSSAIDPTFTRRSRRLMQQQEQTTPEQTEQVTGATVDNNQKVSHPKQEKDQSEVSFEVSPLVQYAMTAYSASTPMTFSSNAGTNLFDTNHDDKGTVSGLAPLYHKGRHDCRLSGPMGAIYSLNFWKDPYVHPSSSSSGGHTTNNNHNWWLVGAGKSGIVAIWDCASAVFGQVEKLAEAAQDDTYSSYDDLNDDCATPPLVSWKAHSGRWIADAQFLAHGGGAEYAPNSSGSSNNCKSSSSSNATELGRLLTAGNDGTVCLWDLSTQSRVTGAPRLLGQSNKQLHASGIFCMDLLTKSACSTTSFMATGSKDKTIAVTKLFNHPNDAKELQTTGTLPSPIWRSTFHTAKVTAVQWQSGSTDDATAAASRIPLLASASDDGQVAVHDCRIDGNSITSPLIIMASHHRPHSVLWEPDSSFGLLTAGLDSTLHLFDIRFPSVPTWSMEGHVPTTNGRGARRMTKIHTPTFFSPHQMLRNAQGTLRNYNYILTGGQDSHCLSMFRYNKVENTDMPTSSLDFPMACDNNNNDPTRTVSTRNITTRREKVFSRGRLPENCTGSDIGCIACHSSSNLVAASVDGGEVLLLAPQRTTTTAIN